MKNNQLQKYEEKKLPSWGRVVGRSNRLTPTLRISHLQDSKRLILFCWNTFGTQLQSNMSKTYT